MQQRLLVIGYGNPYCHDDGVGFHIVNLLRKQWGSPPLEPDEDGIDQRGGPQDTLVVHQLVPELAALLAPYALVVFVDAHVGTFPEDVRVVPVREEFAFHAVTHHLSPGMLLAMARRMNGTAPAGQLVSVKGDDFDFGFGLSETCWLRAEKAVLQILSLAEPFLKTGKGWPAK